MFRLFAGTFEMNFIGNTLDERINNLKKKLELFYSKVKIYNFIDKKSLYFSINFYFLNSQYLLTLKLNACDIVDLTRSMQYLPLQKFQFLRVHNFINMIEETFPTIENCIFLYNDQLVW